LGALGYDTFGRMNGRQAAMLLIYLQPGANALSTMQGLEAALDNLRAALPEGVSIDIPFDTTSFIEVSIKEVVKTFFEALILVLLVVFVFLGSWRATIIPMLAVPVAIVGTFTGMMILGFSV